jgi:hypothetical protein
MSEIPIVPRGRKASAHRLQVKQVRLNLVYVDVMVGGEVSSSGFNRRLDHCVSGRDSVLAAVEHRGCHRCLEGIVGDILGDGGGAILALPELWTSHSFGFVGALINLVSLTVLGSLGAVLYNVIARLTAV